MYEDYLQKALSNTVTARSALYEYGENINSKLGKNMKNIAAYNMQQAIEHIIKYLIYNNINYNKGSNSIRQILTHDIDKLIKQYCKPYGIKVPDRIVKNADIYSRWESESRYTLEFSVRKDSIRSAIIEVENWLIKLNPIYRKNISIYKNKYRLDV